jgi:hypothetical protein
VNLRLTVGSEYPVSYIRAHNHCKGIGGLGSEVDRSLLLMYCLVEKENAYAVASLV